MTVVIIFHEGQSRAELLVMCQHDASTVSYYASIRREPDTIHPALRPWTPERQTFADWDSISRHDKPDTSLARSQSRLSRFHRGLSTMHTGPYPDRYFENPRRAPTPMERQDLILSGSRRALKRKNAVIGTSERRTQAVPPAQVGTPALVQKPLPPLPFEQPMTFLRRTSTDSGNWQEGAQRQVKLEG